jgi:hypothetical protein
MAQAREAEADMVIAIKHALDDLVNAGARGHADGLHLSKVAALAALRAALGTRHHLDEAVQTVLQFETEANSRRFIRSTRVVSSSFSRLDRA